MKNRPSFQTAVRGSLAIVISAIVLSTTSCAESQNKRITSSNVLSTNLAMSPDFSHDKTIFATALEAGVYKTTDGGKRWRQLRLGNGFDSREAQIIQLHVSSGYATNHTVTAHLQMHDIDEKPVETGGIIRSVNGGRTWKLESPRKEPFRRFDTWSRIYASPTFATDRTIFANAVDGIHKSVDAGISWSMVLKATDTGPPAMSIEMSPTFRKDQTVFANDGERVMRSVDGGNHWQVVGNGISGTPHKFLMSPDYMRDRTVFAVTHSWSERAYAVYKSTDGGDSWHKLRIKFPKTRNINLVISPDYGNDQGLYISFNNNSSPKNGVYRSLDGGASWTPVNNGLSKQDVVVTWSSKKRVIKKGKAIIFSGRLMKSDGKPFANQQLFIGPDIFMSPWRTATTNKNGMFSVKVVPMETAVYNATYPGDYTHHGAYDGVQIIVK